MKNSLKIILCAFLLTITTMGFGFSIQNYSELTIQVQQCPSHAAGAFQHVINPKTLDPGWKYTGEVKNMQFFFLTGNSKISTIIECPNVPNDTAIMVDGECGEIDKKTGGCKNFPHPYGWSGADSCSKADAPC